ncbi:39S ribosomal protein L54, mitochondrial [Anthonomus grandis grandis]|uniref:39S ribosomal protein L54, mitochondrial n=1 Tax=Anthonomus grandis grandis TaxID=2921223 RepID=UPI002165805D|nr:39S ribosomal protein L54, mitochondrial [Anthonomus grandis grandis]
MNFSSFYNLAPLKRCLVLSFELNFPRNNYAKANASSVSMLGMKKKKVGKSGPIAEKKVLPVETDPEKLVNYCCGANIFKTGEEIKLAPHSEYPSWLWEIRTGPPPPLEEMDPNSKAYWRRIRKMGIKKHNELLKLKKF